MPGRSTMTRRMSCALIRQSGAAALDHDSARGAVGAQEDRCANHALAANKSNLRGLVQRWRRNNGRKPTLDKPGIRDHFVRLDQHLAHFQRNALQMRVEEVQLLQGEACQKSIFGDGSCQMKTSLRPSLGKSTPRSPSHLRPE